MNRAWERLGEGLPRRVKWLVPWSRPDIKCPVYGAAPDESGLGAVGWGVAQAGEVACSVVSTGHEVSGLRSSAR